MNEEWIELPVEETIDASIEEDSLDVVNVVSEDVVIPDVALANSVVEVDAIEEIEIDMEESIGWVGGDSTRHYSLYGRNDPDQHSISSITGLEKELTDLKKIKTLYSDKNGVTNYYEWHKDVYEAGYFVSLCDDSEKVTLCTGNNIFGVTVDEAGFIGGYNAVFESSRSYVLVATTGLVHVMCESNVVVGDYVISNAYGKAKKSVSQYGYKVVAIENKNGVKYAKIALGIQADVIDALGVDILLMSDDLKNNEEKTEMAINVANLAYSLANHTDDVANNAYRYAESANERASNAIKTAQDIDNKFTNTNNAVLQARAIAEGAAVGAETASQSVASLSARVDDAGADIALVVYEKGGEKVVNAASIVAAINEGGSAIGISADCIAMTGTTTFLRPEDVGEGGATTIDGSRVQTGTISAERLDLSGTLTVSAKKDLVSFVEVLYARSSSAIEFIATTTWSSVAPQWVDGEYMWQQTITTYADHTDTNPHQKVTTTCIHGAKGETGASPYFVRIDSTNGNIFKNGEIETILTATVFYGDKDITNDIMPGRFLWTRVSTDTQGDIWWNEQKSNNRSKQITITSDDVWKKATFFCIIQDE